ncbi:ATP-binding protein [Halomicrococcus sp. NG-SE-24]|uniref:ATP-binding protein n=1 Tax=Halomicrococcus sp. NG-SE-24 TaxID=3436928 RepID=UPI003D951C55
MAGELMSYIGMLVPALLSVVAIPLSPLAIAVIIFTVIDAVFGEDNEGIDKGWSLGIVIGTVMLTLVWFLPLWEHNWPVLAKKLRPFRLSALFDDFWLMGFTWLVSIPMMAYANLKAVTTDDTRSSMAQDKRPVKPNPLEESEELNQSTNKTTNHREEPTFENTEFTYEWSLAPDTRFADIGGMGALKTEIERSILRPLTRIDDAYERFDVSPPNGILLYGPPGTGKTLFARAIAGELGHPYLELSAGDIKSRWINESTEQVNQLFNEAAQFDRCVIFIDEIDALLAGRGNDLHREHAQVVNEFLAHLDDEDPNFLVIAATNRPDLLDEAATRRGRFDQQYELGLPDKDARKAIFRVRLRDRPTALDEAEYRELADRSEGLSSADIVGIVDDAAVSAAERNAEAITAADLFESFP